MGEEEQSEIVLDHGTDTIKAGFGGDDAPHAEFSSLVGCSKVPKTSSDSGIEKVYIGDEAMIKRKLLKLTFPIEHGMITSWDAMEKIWQHTFSNELRVDSEEHPVLCTETPFTPKQSREKLAEKMFELFGIPAIHISSQHMLSLFAVGRTTGLVIGAGEGTPWVR